MAQVFKGAGTAAAKITGEDPELDRVAATYLAKIKANAITPGGTGEFAASFHTSSARGKKGVRDRIIFSTDPNAVSKEAGHIAHHADGSVTKVEGLRAVRRAIE